MIISTKKKIKRNNGIFIKNFKNRGFICKQKNEPLDKKITVSLPFEIIKLKNSKLIRYASKGKYY